MLQLENLRPDRRNSTTKLDRPQLRHFFPDGRGAWCTHGGDGAVGVRRGWSDGGRGADAHRFHYAHVLIVEEDEDPAPVLLKAETDRPLVDSVYLQCETVVPFTRIRVHVFNPADGSSHFLPRTGAEEESSATSSFAPHPGHRRCEFWPAHSMRELYYAMR